MNKEAITHSLTENYDAFISYIHNLTAEEYQFRHEEKWTAGQQLKHIVLSVKPLVQAFSMDKTAIAQTFGQTDKAGRTYDALRNDYIEKLNQGGKTPERYAPAMDLPEQKEALSETLANSVKELCAKTGTFSEQELDSLLIPHPLLGSITLREMLYNTIYHVTHHQSQAQENLKHKTGIHL